MSVTPADGHVGAGVLPKALTADSALALEPVICKRNPHGWTGPSEIRTGLPIPGKVIYGVGGWIANVAIRLFERERYSCIMLKEVPLAGQRAQSFKSYVGVSTTGEVDWTQGLEPGAPLSP